MSMMMEEVTMRLMYVQHESTLESITRQSWINLRLPGRTTRRFPKWSASRTFLAAMCRDGSRAAPISPVDVSSAGADHRLLCNSLSMLCERVRPAASGWRSAADRGTHGLAHGCGARAFV
jgi:hypothetical protein